MQGESEPETYKRIQPLPWIAWFPKNMTFMQRERVLRPTRHPLPGPKPNPIILVREGSHVHQNSARSHHQAAAEVLQLQEKQTIKQVFQRRRAQNINGPLRQCQRPHDCKLVKEPKQNPEKETGGSCLFVSLQLLLLACKYLGYDCALINK